MKKLFTFALMAAISLTAFAQEEEDMTHYIQNPGFDEDVSWTIDGQPAKEIIATDHSLSGRSWAWVSEDNSVYCRAKTTGNGSWKRDADGYAYNGFVAQIKGWELITGAAYYPLGTASPEWVYFASVPYSLGNTAIPISDDGTTYLAAVPKPAEYDTDENVAAVYLRAGWGGSAAYKQTVKLPCAQYRLDYWIYNANYAASASNTGVVNLCKVTCRKDVYNDDEGFNAQEWTKHSIEFTPTTDFSIQFGFTSSGGSGSNPFLFIDGIRLYKIGEADEAELLQSDLMDFLDSLENIMNDEFYAYDGFIDYIGDKMMEFQSIADKENVEEMKQATEDVKAFIDKLWGALDNINKFNDSLAEAEALLVKTEDDPYPGVNAFLSAVEALTEYAENGYAVTSEGDDPCDFLTTQTEELNKAIDAYKYSQKATKDNPADYTFLLQSPEFLTKEAEPTYDEDLYPEYPNGSSYSQGSSPADASGAGWNIGDGGGDQRTNFVQGRACWNSWNNTQGFNELRLYQELTDIPNGYYSVSALMITQSGCITDQHLYAESSAETALSPVLSKDTWSPSTEGTLTEWDFLTTDLVLVTDGKLTIGALGHGSYDLPTGGDYTDYRAGWFCITHFVLKYYGEASNEEIAASYQEKLTEYQAFCDAMGFGADKASFQSIIDQNKNAEGAEAINAALEALSAAYTNALASQTEYEGEISGTYATLLDNIENTYSENQKAAAQPICDLMKAYLDDPNATYSVSALHTPILRYYRDNVLPAIAAAEGADVQDPMAKEAVEGTVKDVVSQLTKIQDFPTTDFLGELVAALQEALKIADVADFILSGDDDYTQLIKNPTITDTYATGWQLVNINTDSNGAKSGQQYDGVSGGYYLDAWNPTPGMPIYTASQTLVNIPNGTYELKAMLRVSGQAGQEGYYLFSIADNDTVNGVFAPVHMEQFNYTQYVDAELVAEGGADSIAYVSDTYGSIWVEAADFARDELGINLLTEHGEEVDYALYEKILDYEAEHEGNISADTQLKLEILKANNGLGRGWHYLSLQIEVKDHQLQIGVTTDSTFTAGHTDTEGKPCVPFSGSWFSADNFTLRLVQIGDNEGWNPASSIETLEAIKPEYSAAPKGIYNLNGMKIGSLQKGINIIKLGDGSVKKVLLK